MDYDKIIEIEAEDFSTKTTENLKGSEFRDLIKENLRLGYINGAYRSNQKPFEQ